MKNIFITIATIILSLHIVSAQDSIMVTVTETCSPLSGAYELDGTLNGKNQYSRILIDGIDTTFLYINYDSTKWVFYLLDIVGNNAFYNLNVPTEMLPPNTGWVADICDGTMVIEGGVSLGIKDELPENYVRYYKTFDNNLIIELDNKYNSIDTQIELYDLSGKKLISKHYKPNANYELSLSNLKAGVYIVRVLSNGKQLTSFRVLK